MTAPMQSALRIMRWEYTTIFIVLIIGYERDHDEDTEDDCTHIQNADRNDVGTDALHHQNEYENCRARGSE